MKLSEIFEIIEVVFSRSVNNLKDLNINSELDWERHLYCEFQDELRQRNVSNLIIYLETGAYKTGNNILWISPNSFNKKSEEITKYCYYETDDIGYYKIRLDNFRLPLTSSMKIFLKKEKVRNFYIDIIVFDQELKRSIAYIELKYKNGLKENLVLEDYYKLKRLESVRKFKTIYLALGYDTETNKFYCLSPNPEYTFIIQKPDDVKKLSFEDKQPDIMLNPNEIISISKEVAKKIYQIKHASEATWAGELMYNIQKSLPADYRINSEIQISGKSQGRIDLGIYDSNNRVKYAIEIKGHYEKPFPKELLNNLYRDKELENAFIDSSSVFLEKYAEDKNIKNLRSTFPKLDKKDFVNPDFFEKIVEMYNQCYRISRAIEKGIIEYGFMFFIDHNDDYDIRSNTYGISRDIFIKNFQFRKRLIKSILSIDSNNLCNLVYMYKLNKKSDKKELYFVD